MTNSEDLSKELRRIVFGENNNCLVDSRGVIEYVYEWNDEEAEIIRMLEESFDQLFSSPPSLADSNGGEEGDADLQ